MHDLPDYWLVHLSLDQSAFPSSLEFSFASGALATVSFSGNSWVEGSGYRGTYVSYANLGAGDQLVTVSGEVSSSLNPIAYLKSGPACSLPGPTATAIPTVTPTPTWSGTTTPISATSIDCAPNAALWQFRLTIQGALPGGASWPAAVDMTFASGATGTAIKISETLGENAAQLEYRSQDNLTDALVAGTLSLPTGLTGVLELMYAPNCSPAMPSTATRPRPSHYSHQHPDHGHLTAGFDYCTLSPSGWFWVLDFRDRWSRFQNPSSLPSPAEQLRPWRQRTGSSPGHWYGGVVSEFESSERPCCLGDGGGAIRRVGLVRAYAGAELPAWNGR